MRRLGGRSVWSRTIEPLPKSRSSELRSLKLTQTPRFGSSYHGHSEIVKTFFVTNTLKFAFGESHFPDRILSKRNREIEISHKIRSIHHRRVIDGTTYKKRSTRSIFIYIRSVYARSILIRAYIFGLIRLDPQERREKLGTSIAE